MQRVSQVVGTVLFLAITLGVEAQNNLVIIAGSPDGQSALSSVEIVTPTGSCSGRIADFPVDTFGLVSTFLEASEEILACGGSMKGSDPPQSGDCYTYNFGTGEWAPFGTMLTQRSFAAITRAAGKVYVIGGEKGVNILSSVESFDEATGLWSEELDIPFKLKTACAVGLEDGRVLLSGGFGGTPNGVFMLDSEGLEWTPIEPSTFGRADHACMTFNLDGADGVIIAAGQSTPLATDKVEFYDLAASTWSTLAPMSATRFGHEMGALDGVATTVGGYFNAPVSQFDGTAWMDREDLALETPRGWYAMAEVPATLANCEVP